MISSTDSSASFSCSGGYTYSFTFPVTEAADISVYLEDSLGVITQLSLTADYTVSFTNNDPSSGGVVTTISAYASGNTIVVSRDVDATQEAVFTEGMPTLYGTFEDALDKLTMLAQELKNRAISLPGSAPSASTEFPSPAANAMIGWNSAASALENKVATTISIGDFAVIGDYGNSLATAVSTIGSTTIKTVIMNAPNAVTANLVVPSNIHLLYLPEGVTTISIGKTLSIRTFTAGRFQIFAGSGTAILNGTGTFFPEWYGVVMAPTVGLASTAFTTEMQRCVNSCYASNYDSSYATSGGIIDISSGTLCTGQISTIGKPNVSFKGKGKSSTIWLSSGSVNPLLLMGATAGPAANIYSFIEDIMFVGGGSANALLAVNFAAQFDINRCHFLGDASTSTLASFVGSLSWTMKNSFTQGGLDYAIDIYGSNSTGDTANNILLEQNEITSSGIGIRFQGGDMLRIKGGAIEGCGIGGVKIANTDGSGVGISATIDGVWFEANAGKSIELLSGENYRNQVFLKDLIIIGNNSTSTYGVYANGGTYGVGLKVTNVVAQNSVTRDFYATGNVSGIIYDSSFATFTGTPNLFYNTYPAASQGSRYANIYTSQVAANFALGDNPSVYYGDVFITANTGATNVTTLADGQNGQRVYIWGGDGGKTTFKHGTGTDKISINAGSDVTLADGKSLVLMYISGQWHEIGGLR